MADSAAFDRWLRRATPAGALTRRPAATRGACTLHPTVKKLKFNGFDLAYEVQGEGSRDILLLHGLTLSRKMHYPLAEELVARGNRVILLDLLGHGDSDRPRGIWRYSMAQFADQSFALLEELGVGEVVVGGTSLGANVTLEMASRDPDRIRGMIVEMPVLDHALVACAIIFTPMLIALQVGSPVVTAAGKVLSRVPRGMHHLADLLLDAGVQDPQSLAAVFKGLFFGRVAPPRDIRPKITSPAIVLGHPADVIHPFSDAELLATELPNGRLVVARSIYEMRIWPKRLTDEICAFVDECWASAPAGIDASSNGGARSRSKKPTPARGRKRPRA